MYVPLFQSIIAFVYVTIKSYENIVMTPVHVHGNIMLNIFLIIIFAGKSGLMITHKILSQNTM